MPASLIGRGARASAPAAAWIWAKLRRKLTIFVDGRPQWTACDTASVIDQSHRSRDAHCGAEQRDGIRVEFDRRASMRELSWRQGCAAPLRGKTDQRRQPWTTRADWIRACVPLPCAHEPPPEVSTAFRPASRADGAPMSRHRHRSSRSSSPDAAHGESAVWGQNIGARSRGVGNFRSKSRSDGATDPTARRAADGGALSSKSAMQKRANGRSPYSPCYAGPR